MNMHWKVWRDTVERYGFTEPLKIASSSLQCLDCMTPEEVEELFAAVDKGDDKPQCLFRMRRYFFRSRIVTKEKCNGGSILPLSDEKRRVRESRQ